MLKDIAYTLSATLVLAFALVIAPAFSAKDTHEASVPNADKAAQQAIN